MSRQPAVRPYRDGDEIQILELFERSFHSARSIESWDWKYRRNPYGNLRISLAFSGEGNLVAHYAAYPCQVYDTSGSEPRTIVAHQIGDTMTSRRALAGSGIGRPSLLERVTQHFFSHFCQGRVGFNYGINHGKIQHYYLELVPGSRYLEAAPLRVLNLGGGLAVAATRGEEFSIRVERQRQLDSRWDQFFQRVAPDYQLLAERDWRYLAWRYLACPDTEYSIHTAFCEETILGWGVFRRVDDSLVWGDALFDRRYPETPGTLLARVLSRPEHNAVRRVEGWFPDRPGWWNRALCDLGFESRPEPQELGLIYKPFEERNLTRRLGEHLYYTKGDSDLF